LRSSALWPDAASIAFMTESPIDALRRWEDHGAEWRVAELTDERAVVDLCTCYGEPVDRLESADPELIEFLRSHGSAGAAAG
jgi:hypothetical protein